MSSVAESIKTSNAKRAREKIKGVCSRKSTIPNCIDNVQGEANIAKGLDQNMINYFQVFQPLFLNWSRSGQKLMKILIPAVITRNTTVIVT